MNARQTISFTVILACAQLAQAAPDGAATKPAAVCRNTVRGVELPVGWTRSVRDGIVSYRDGAQRQALTLAAYSLNLPQADQAARTQLLLDAARRERETERRWSGDSLVLSALASHRTGALTQVCHSGWDRTADRRFVSITIALPRVVQHIYYEALGTPEPAFASQIDRLFSARSASSRENVPGTWRLDMSPLSLVPPNRLPLLGMPR